LKAFRAKDIGLFETYCAYGYSFAPFVLATFIASYPNSTL